MFCPHCGRKIDDDSVFCVRCGNRIDEQPDTDARSTARRTAGQAVGTGGTQNRPAMQRITAGQRQGSGMPRQTAAGYPQGGAPGRTAAGYPQRQQPVRRPMPEDLPEEETSKKSILTILIICVAIAAALAAVVAFLIWNNQSDAGAPEKERTEESSEDEEEKEEKETETASGSEKPAKKKSNVRPEDIKGTVYNTGAFRVFVPEGWTTVEQQDLSRAPDANGAYPADPYSLILLKGSSSRDLFDHPAINVRYFKGTGVQEQIRRDKAAVDSAEDREVSVGGKACFAFEAREKYYGDTDSFILTDYVYYPLGEDEFFRFEVPVDMVDYEGVSLDDPDVIRILEGAEAAG